MKKKDLYELIKNLEERVNALNHRLLSLEESSRKTDPAPPGEPHPVSDTPMPVFVPTGPTSPFYLKAKCAKCGLDRAGATSYACMDPQCPSMSVVTCHSK